MDNDILIDKNWDLDKLNFGHIETVNILTPYFYYPKIPLDQ